MTRKFILITCLFCAIILAGCGNDQYAIEKQFWQAQRQAEKIFKNPAASPPKELVRVVNHYNRLIKKYPNNILSIDAEFNIARLYIIKEEYNKARIQLKAMFDKYKKFDAICAEALFLIGNSYEIQDKWGAALEQYKRIMLECPLTLRGINVPIYIAQHYKIKHQPDKMIAAFHEAISHYNGLAGKHPDSPLAYSLNKLAADCYLEIKDWQSAIATLNAIVEKYKGKVSVDGVLMDIALIYHRELKDNTKAKETLQRLIKEYPKSRLVNPANIILKKLEKE